MNNVSVRYGKTTVLRNVTGDIFPGELTVLAGPNGAGKTSLLNAFIGRAELAAGKVNFESELLDPHDESWREIFSSIAADSGVLPILTVGEQLELLCRITEVGPEVSRKRTAELLQLLELTGHRDYRGDELSSGLKKRLQIGLGIARNVPVYLFDEPFNGLDANSIVVLQEIFRTLVKRKKYVLIASHLLRQLDGFSVSVWELRKGELLGIRRGEKGKERLRELSASASGSKEGDILSWVI